MWQTKDQQIILTGYLSKENSLMTKKENTFLHMVQGFPHPLSVLEDYIAMITRFPRYVFCMHLFGWILTLNSRYNR